MSASTYKVRLRLPIATRSECGTVGIDAPASSAGIAYRQAEDRSIAGKAAVRGGLRLSLMTAVAIVGLASRAQAQFGVKCDSPAFAYTLAESKLTDDIQAAIRATCAFSKKYAEVGSTFKTPNWSWDLLPKARADVAELTDLANKAAELNFKTNDPRALGNIKHMYMRVGSQQRWLAEQENKFANYQKKLALTPQAGATVDPSAPAITPATVSVVFQDNVSEADKDAFLKAYGAEVIEGPNADRSYRLRLGTPLPVDQLQLVLESMKTQINVVKTASGD